MWPDAYGHAYQGTRAATANTEEKNQHRKAPGSRSFPVSAVPVDLLHIYAAAGAAVTFGVLQLRKNRKTFHGELSLLWIMLYSCSRLFEEFFRGGERGDLVLGRYPSSQVLALLLLIGAAALYPVLRKKNRCP